MDSQNRSENPHTDRIPTEVLTAFQLNCGPQDGEFLGQAGGFSGALLWRLPAASATPPAVQSLCIRGWPESVSAQRIRTIHAGIQAIAQHAPLRLQQSLALPRELADGQTLIRARRRWFEVARWLPGSANFHADPSTSRLVNIMHWLAEFHAAAERAGPVARSRSAGLEHRIVRCRQLLTDRLARIQTALLASQYDFAREVGLPLIEQFCQAAPSLLPLLERRDRQPYRQHLCLRDIWHDHVLLAGEEVTGVVDYDALRVEVPAADIARLLRSLLGNDPRWGAAIAAYGEGRHLTMQDHELIRAFDHANCLMSGIQWLEWLFVEQRTFANFPAALARARGWLGQQPVHGKV